MAKKVVAEDTPVSVSGEAGSSSFVIENVESIILYKNEGFTVTSEDGLTIRGSNSSFNLNVNG